MSRSLQKREKTWWDHLVERQDLIYKATIVFFIIFLLLGLAYLGQAERGLGGITWR